MNDRLLDRTRLFPLAIALMMINVPVLHLPGAERDLAGVVNLEGKAMGALPIRSGQPLVLVFMSVECPIANRYAPTLRRLMETNRAARFVLIYPHPDEDAETVRRHLKEYNLPAEAWRDPGKSLAKLAGATITPEAVVYTGSEMVYRGRIDDQYAAWGKQRSAPTQHDLQDILDALAAGKKVEKRITQAVGCYIASVDE